MGSGCSWVFHLDPTVYDDACADANSSGRPDLEDFAETLGTHVVTWVGPGDGSWHEPANWSSGHVPGPLDVALIAPCSPTGPTVRIAAPATAAAILSSGAIDVDAATLALGGYMTARDLDLRGGAQLGPVADHYARLHLGIGGDMTMETGCVVEVTNAGYPDILSIQIPGPSRSIVWHRNEGGVFTDAIALRTENASLSMLSPTDIDGDSDLDLIWYDGSSEIIEWMENTDGSGNFATAQTLQPVADILFPHLVDLNGDGAPDVAVAFTDDDVCSWYAQHPATHAFTFNPLSGNIGGTRAISTGTVIKTW